MSDFDLSLIREFRVRPAFYDRSSPLFKDKAFNAQAWQEISNILGYDVALLKDRMLQLRNRYNLEKRRLEQLAEENPGKYAHSPWPLYEHLGFLSEHIRSRRSFKRMLPRQTSTDLNMSSGANLSPPALEAPYAAAPLPNGMLAVKLENATEADSDSQSGTDLGAGGDDDDDDNAANHKAVVKAAILANLRKHGNSTSSPSQSTKAQIPPFQQQSISIRNLDSMRSTIPKHKIHAYASNGGSYGAGEDAAVGVVLEKKRCLSAREQKYEAFGQFVASSLEEMPKEQALLLVERFTSEMVRVLIEKNVADSNPSESPAASTAGSLPNNSITNSSNSNNNNNKTNNSTSIVGTNCAEEAAAFQKPQPQQQQQQYQRNAN